VTLLKRSISVEVAPEWLRPVEQPVALAPVSSATEPRRRNAAARAEGETQF
jgi:hypothetical protein